MRHLRLRARRLDAGETLIESLVTIAILGVAVVALLGAILIGIKTSVVHRKNAQAQAELRSWAEQISSTSYLDCATESHFARPALPAGFTPSISDVQHWNGSAFDNAACGPDRGLQKITLRISVADGISPGFTEDLNVVVRRP